MHAARAPTLAFLGLLLGLSAVPVVAQDADDPLHAAPHWAPGDWWLVRFYDGGTVDVTRRLVVAGSDKGEHLVGISRAEGHVELLVYHMPYFGRVDAADLSYQVHNQRFHPLQFPLVEGARWLTQFNDLPLDATVTDARDGVATVEYRADGTRMGKAVYDGRAKTLTSFNLVGHGFMQVQAYGTGYACTVHYPDRYELLFLDHTMGLPSLPVATLTRDDSLRETDINRPYERAAVVLSVGGEEGLFSQQVVTPADDVYEATVLPTDNQRWRAVLHETVDPMGTWRLNSVAVGHGWALAEAIGFDPRLVHLEHVVPDADQRSVDGCPVHVVPQAAAPGTLVPSVRDFAPPLLLLGAGSLVFAGLVAAALKRPWIPWLFLFAKIPPERVLDHRVRHDIHELLRQQPGLTTQEIRRSLDIGWGNTVHHLAILERAGVVSGLRWGHNRNWFLRSETPPAGRTAISALRRDAARKVYECIQATPGISQEDLARELSLHHSTVIFHVDRLMQAALVSKQRDGQRVRYYPGTPESGAHT